MNTGIEVPYTSGTAGNKRKYIRFLPDQYKPYRHYSAYTKQYEDFDVMLYFKKPIEKNKGYRIFRLEPQSPCGYEAYAVILFRPC